MLLYQGTTPDSGETDRLKSLLRPLELAKQIAEDTAEIFTSIPDTMVDIDKQFNSIMQNMGVGRGYSEAIKDNLSKGAYAVLKLGGDIKSATALQNEVVNQFNKNIVLSEDMYAKLYATTKVAGVAAGDLLDGFDKAGMSITHITEQMYNTSKIARDMGVSSQVVSKNVVANLEQLNRFNFVNGVDGLSKMAAKAAMLRIDMKQTLDFADKMLNPEDAINMSAALQRLGNVSSELIDPLRLMDLAQNNVPELQNQLSGLFKQYTFFNEETQAFEFFPDAKMKIRELAKELQIPQSEIEKMALGTASLDKKLADIDFSGFNNISDDTKNAIANLATLDKNTGEYVIETKDKGLVSVQKLLESYSGDIGELQKYISGLEEEAGKTPEEQMMELAKQQLGLTGEMVANLEAMTKSLGLQISSTQKGQTVLKTATEGVNLYAEVQQGMYQPGVKGGYKGQKNQYEQGTIAGADKYIKNGKLDFIELLSDSTGQAADKVKLFANQIGITNTKLSSLLDVLGMSKIKESFGVEDAVYFPEQNQVINKDKNDLVVFAQKENINVKEELPEPPKIQIPDFSDSIISALENLKFPQPVNTIDPFKMAELTKNVVTNEINNNFSKNITNQNQTNEVVQLTQMMTKNFELPLEQLRQSMSSIITQKTIQPPRQIETVREVINQPAVNNQTTASKETKITHNITLTFKAEGNNQALQQIADNFKNNDTFKSKVIQSLDIKKTNYGVDNDTPFQNYVEQISIA